MFGFRRIGKSRKEWERLVGIRKGVERKLAALFKDKRAGIEVGFEEVEKLMAELVTAERNVMAHMQMEVNDCDRKYRPGIKKDMIAAMEEVRETSAFLWVARKEVIMELWGV